MHHAGYMQSAHCAQIILIGSLGRNAFAAFGHLMLRSGDVKMDANERNNNCR